MKSWRKAVVGTQATVGEAIAAIESGSIQIARFCYSQLGMSRRSTMNINVDNGLACLTKISGASSASTVSPLPHIASSA